MKVLLFSSPTCGPCKQLKQTLETLKLEVDGVINIAEPDNVDLISKYKIRAVPALVLTDKDGKAIDVKVGFNGDLDSIKSFFKNRKEND